MSTAPLNPYKVAHLATTEAEAREAAAKIAAGHFLSGNAFDASLVSVEVPKDGSRDVATVKIATLLGVAELQLLPDLSLSRDSRLGPLQARVLLGVVGVLVGVAVAGVVWDTYTHRHPWFATYGTGPLALGIGCAGGVALAFAVLGFLRITAARTAVSSFLPLGLAVAGFVGEAVVLNAGLPSSAAAKAALDRGDLARAASEASAMLATKGHDPVADEVLDALKLHEVRSAREVALKVRRFGGVWYTPGHKLRAIRDIENLALVEASTQADKRQDGALRDLKFIVKPVDESIATRIAGIRLQMLVDDCLATKDYACAERALREEEPDGYASDRAAHRARIVKGLNEVVDGHLATARSATDAAVKREGFARAYHAAKLAFRLTGDDKARPLNKLLDEYRAAQAAEFGLPADTPSSDDPPAPSPLPSGSAAVPPAPALSGSATP